MLTSIYDAFALGGHLRGWDLPLNSLLDDDLSNLLGNFSQISVGKLQAVTLGQILFRFASRILASLKLATSASIGVTEPKLIWQ